MSDPPWWTRIEEPNGVVLRRLAADDAAGCWPCTATRASTSTTLTRRIRTSPTRFAPEAQGRGARRVAERAGYVDEGLEPGTTDMQLLRLVSPGARSGE